MDLTELTQIFLSDKQQQESRERIISGYSLFTKWIKELGRFGVYFDKQYNYAYILNTIFLLRRLEQDCGIVTEEKNGRDKITLIYDEADQELVMLLKGQIPFFNNYNKGKLDGELPDFLICGGNTFCNMLPGKIKINASYLLEIKPYTDDTGYSVFHIKQQNGEWIYYIADAMFGIENFRQKNYYIDSPKDMKLSDSLKNYWKQIPQYKEPASRVEALIKFKDVSVFTVDGLADGSQGSSALEGTSRADTALLVITMAMAKIWKKDKPVIFALTDFTSATDNHLMLLKYACDCKTEPSELLGKLTSLYPQAAEDNLKTGLLNPILKKRQELGEILDCVTITDTLPSNIDKKIYIYPVGKLPYDYMQVLFAASTFLFFESVDYMNLAVNLGIPFLHQSIEVAEAGYPSLLSPGTAKKLEQLCKIFKSLVSSYYSAMNTALSEEIDNVADFLKSPEREYFEELRRIAQGIPEKDIKTLASPGVMNDKLAAAAGYCYEMYQAACIKKENESSFDAKILYQKLLSAYDEKKQLLDLSLVLRDTRTEKYLKEIAGVQAVHLHVPSREDIQLDKDEDKEAADMEQEMPVYGVIIYNASLSALEGISFEIRLSLGQDMAKHNTTIQFSLKEDTSFSGLSWLSLSDVHFNISFSEGNLPVSALIGGYLGKTEKDYGIAFNIDLDGQNGVMKLVAERKEPLTVYGIFEAIAGGLSFSNLLPSQLMNSGNPVLSLGITGLKLNYNRNCNEISYMEFTFANQAKNIWVLWKNENAVIEVVSPEIKIGVLSPGDSGKRKTFVSINSFLELLGSGNKYNEEQGEQLFMEASFPPFKAQMRLACERVSLSKILNVFGCHVDWEADIIDLVVSADLDEKKYEFSAAVSGEWELCSHFTLTGVGLHILEHNGSFSIAFAGIMQVFNVSVMASASYFSNGTWKLHALAELNEKITMEQLLNEYKGDSLVASFENGEDNPLVASLSFSVDKPASSGKNGVNFEVAASIEHWNISLFKGEQEVSAKAAVGRKDNSFYGYIEAGITLLGAEIQIKLNYSSGNKGFELSWNNFHAQVVQTGGETKAVFILKQFSIGKIIETFIGWLYGSPFSLDEPWNILNQCCFDIDMVYHFEKKQFELDLELDYNLGFGSIQKIQVVYNPKADSKVDLSLVVKYAWETEAQTLNWDASKPGTAPAPAGNGSSYFDLNYLAFGQHMEFFKKGKYPEHTNEAIKYLEENMKPDTMPAYNADNGMLTAADFGILKENNEYFLKAEVVFYDPALYALNIAMAGKAAKIFKGFSFEIIYAKLSESLGVFRSTLVLPDRFRQLELGIFSITIPDFYLEIYTNGDFKADIGFPKNGDFSRSFTISAVIPPGLPVTGAAGLYFGKLSTETAKSAKTKLPSTDKGEFKPVIIFGLGLRIGIGKSLDCGILKGSVSLTLDTILEGVFAKWISHKEKEGQEPWYYHLEGTASLVGNIYGEINLAIITASVNLCISISVSFIYEVYRKVSISIDVMVKAEISLKINLGIFKINIHFNFKLNISAGFTIGEDKTAPWDMVQMYNKNTLVQIPDFNFSYLCESGKKLQIKACLSLAATSALDEYGSGSSLVLHPVIMTLDGGDNFNQMAEYLVYWLFAAVYGSPVYIDGIKKFMVDKSLLQGMETYFSENEQPILLADAEGFLSRFVVILVQDNEVEMLRRQNETETAPDVYFPLPAWIKLTAIYGDKIKYSYTLNEYNSIADGALSQIKKYFREMAMAVQHENKLAAKEDFEINGQSVAQMVFSDWFTMAATYIIHMAKQVFENENQEQMSVESLASYFSRQNKYQELAGIMSRYFLHGLRLPASDRKQGIKWIIPDKKGLWVKDGADGFTLPDEAGIFALAGQMFEAQYEGESLSVLVESDRNPVVIPDGFHLNIGQDNTQDGLLMKMNQVSLNLQVNYSIAEQGTGFVPVTISFPDPVNKNGRSLWTLPDSLLSYYRANTSIIPEFSLDLVSYNNGEQKKEIALNYLVMVEFSIEASQTSNVYIIKSPAKDAVSLLAKLILEYINNIGHLELMVSKEQEEDSEVFWAISQKNLSTDSRPPEYNSSLGYNEDEETLKMLWKALVTNNGGYFLTYRDNKGTILSGNVTLAVYFEPGFTGYPVANAVISGKTVDKGWILAACATEKQVMVPYQEIKELTMAEIASRYWTDIQRIAENNLSLYLEPAIEWRFEGIIVQDEDTAKVLDAYTAFPKENETLSGFAQRNHTTAAYALWLNRDTSGLFAPSQKLLIISQAGNRAGSGSENTNSLINENFCITRPDCSDIGIAGEEGYEEKLLSNNYSLLSYAIDGADGYSAPVSYEKGSQGLTYHVTVPVDRYFGGSYCSYGKLVKYNFKWLDYYGNVMDNSFYSFRLEGYQDTLNGFSKWQSLSIRWELIEGHATQIRIKMDFSKDDYNNDEKRKNALGLYQQIKEQMQDSRVGVYLTFSMFNGKSDIKYGYEWIEMINNIIQFLHQEIETVPEREFIFTFGKNPGTSEQLLFPLECNITIERYGKAGRGLEEVKNILSAGTSVSYGTDELRKLDTQFRKLNPGYILLKSGSEGDIYVCNTTGIKVTVNNESINLFVPSPFSNVLKSFEDVNIYVYKNKELIETEKKRFLSADLNVWMHNALQFAEECMREEVISAARLTGSDYKQMLTVLKELAQILSKRLIPAYKEEIEEINVCEEAVEVFKQRLLGSLTAYYTTKAVAVFYATTEGIPEGMVLYCNISDSNNNSLVCQQFLAKNGENKKYAITISGQEIVTDSFGAVIAKADIKPAFSVAHIKDNIIPVVDGFEYSDWYSPVSGEITGGKMVKDNLMVPFPLYTFPETPVMTGHEVVNGKQPDTWRYAFTYTRSFHYPQQICQCKVVYNNIGKNNDRQNTKNVFALASLNQVGNTVLDDIKELAGKIMASPSVIPDEQTTQDFKLAYSSAVKLLSGIKEEMESLEEVNTGKQYMDNEEIIQFAVKEQPDGQNRFLMVLDIHGVEPQISGYHPQETEDGWLFIDDTGNYLAYTEGQRIKKRTMLMPEKKILLYQDGIANISVDQNRCIGNREMNEKLVYTTGEISFDSAIHAYRVIEKHNLAGKSTRVRPLKEYLSQYLREITGGGSNITIQAQCSISSRIYENIKPVVYPVFSQVKADISNENIDIMAEEWNNHIKKWWDSSRGTKLAEKEKISFELHFFSKKTSVPLLTVKELYITGGNVTW